MYIRPKKPKKAEQKHNLKLLVKVSLMNRRLGSRPETEPEGIKNKNHSQIGRYECLVFPTENKCLVYNHKKMVTKLKQNTNNTDEENKCLVCSYKPKNL